jgi:hypothetical protein
VIIRDGVPARRGARRGVGAQTGVAAGWVIR